MFELYKVETATFRFADYALLMQEAAGKKSALEIGPGYSTLALIEAGVEKIVTLEHDPEWLDRAREMFKDHPQVEIRSYIDEPEAKGDLEESEKFDIAFVDSPKGFHKPVQGIKGMRHAHPGQEDCSRFNTCLLALKHAPIVYLHDAYRPFERATLGRLSSLGHKVEYLNGSKVGMARIERHG